MIKIYLCGPTVYNDIHIGNARPILIVDFYIRALRTLGKKFFFVENITDIDDKIIHRAKEQKISEIELSQNYAKRFFDIRKKLNTLSPNESPKVTDHIKGIISFVKRLVEENRAYESERNILLDTQSISEYGSMSGFKMEDLEFSEPEIPKKHPADFALWKPTSIGVTWDSPWGKGRPGWHTECAYFIDKYFNNSQLDLHCGGIDLKFPHNENENAQFLALYNLPISKEWKHFGHLNLNGDKMSKSLGNFVYVFEFIQKYDFDFLRFIFFTTNPFTPLDFDDKFVSAKLQEFEKIKSLFKDVNKQFSFDKIPNDKEIDSPIIESVENFDFSSANKQLWKLINEYRKNNLLKTGLKIINTLNALGFSFSIKKWDEDTLRDFYEWERLVSAKKYEEADTLRSKLKKEGIF